MHRNSSVCGVHARGPPLPTTPAGDDGGSSTRGAASRAQLTGITQSTLHRLDSVFEGLFASLREVGRGNASTASNPRLSG